MALRSWTKDKIKFAWREVPYKNPNNPKRVLADFKYANSERGFVTFLIASKFTPSNGKSRGHFPDSSLDKKEVWRIYMNHLIKMKEKFPDTDGRLCIYCEQPYTFMRRVGTRGEGRQGRKSQTKTNLSLDRWDPRITYTKYNIVFCCIDCNDKKRDSNPDDWKNYQRVGKEIIND
jgi:hypothetical protein